MICPPWYLALPLPLSSDLRRRARKPLYFLKFFIKYQQDKSCIRHGIYPYLCPKYCNERYMDRTLGSVPLSLSIDSTRVCRMACDMRGWSVAMPLIEEMATQMDSSIWSTRQTYTSYRYNNIIIEPRRCSAMAVSSSGLFFCVPLSSVLHEHR